MKVKNIMFSGFAAAILMGTVSANAATPFKIASQAYVDRQINNLSGANGAISEVSSAVDTLAGQIAGENETLDDGFTSDTVVGAVNELKDSVDTLAGDANTPGSVAEAKAAADAAQDDVDALEAAVGDGFGTGQGQQTVTAAVSGLDTRVGALETTVDTATTGLTARVGALETQVGTGTMTVGGTARADVVAAINALDAKTEGIATAGNLSQLEQTVGTKQDAITATNKLDADLVDDTNSTNKFVTASDKTTWSGKQNALSQTELDSITAAANLLAAGYNSCISAQGGSGHCVLTADSTGLHWIDVTSPFEITD